MGKNYHMLSQETITRSKCTFQEYVTERNISGRVKPQT